jgi:hypothetical protein
MMSLKFFNRTTGKTIEIDVSLNIYLEEIITKIKSEFQIDHNVDISIFYIGPKTKPEIVTLKSTIIDLLDISKTIRHFEVFWKTNTHGKQRVDHSSSELGTVVSGYQRFVSSNPEAGGVTIGDPSGAKVYIPPGALGKSANISIKTVMVDNAKLNLPKGTRNVTKAVISDPNKVNKEMNR